MHLLKVAGVCPARESAKASVIIPLLASNPLSFIRLGAFLLKKGLSFFSLLATCLLLFSCSSSSNNNSSTGSRSGLKFRAFVSNPLEPATRGTLPVINIVDALKDVLSNSFVSVSASAPEPTFMVLFPNKRFTLVYSGSNTSLAVVDNSTESVVGGTSNATTTSIALPGASQSAVVSTDNATGFAAVPAAPPPNGQIDNLPPGLVEILNLTNNTISAEIPVEGARFLALSPDGARLLVFGSRPDTITIITPRAVGSNQPAIVTPISSPSLDHPVSAVFSSDSHTAYILNCGPECGGVQASVTPFDVNSSSALTPISVNGATVALLSGTNLYVAGTNPATACTASTLATHCGTLSVIDVGSSSVATTAEITDGYHDRMQMGANNRLFIGAHTCTNISSQNNNGNGEIRGCLSIASTHAQSIPNVVIPPDNGDVTGIQPIATRNVVYVAQDGELGIYDTTTDKLQATQVDIRGQAQDVKLVD